MSKLSMRGRRWQQCAARVRDRDGHQCVRCGATEDLTVDHIIPLAAMDPEDLEEGWQFDQDNLQTLCRTCNGRKSDRLDDQRTTWLNPSWFAPELWDQPPT